MIVQKLRLQKGWSQTQLAELSGLNVRTIQRIEKGESASNESLKALASVFEMDFNELKTQGGVVVKNIGIAKLNSGLSMDELLAYSRLNRVKSFYNHLIKFVLIVAALGVFNYLKTPTKPWIMWVIIGWGAGLIWHAYRTFVRGFNPEWKKSYIEKQMKHN